MCVCAVSMHMHTKAHDLTVQDLTQTLWGETQISVLFKSCQWFSALPAHWNHLQRLRLTEDGEQLLKLLTRIGGKGSKQDAKQGGVVDQSRVPARPNDDTEAMV